VKDCLTILVFLQKDELEEEGTGTDEGEEGNIYEGFSEKEKKVNGVNHKKAYRIHVGHRDSLKILCKILGIKYSSKGSYKSITSWFDNDFLYTPITKIERKDYKGKVYNLEVED